MLTPLSNAVANYRLNCNNKNEKFIESGWIEKLKDKVSDCVKDALPHGSGIDYEWVVEHKDAFVWEAHNGWHAMDNNGYYCGRVDFSISLDVRDLHIVEICVSDEDRQAIEKEYQDSFENELKYSSDEEKELLENEGHCDENNEGMFFEIL